MNYLAHLYLASPDEGLIVGNFIADSVKGEHFNNFPAPIKSGILMHRAIDDFTDHHSEVLAAKKIFTSVFDKYSGVLVDVYFDHILAIRFKEISGLHLTSFANDTYELLKKHEEHFVGHSNRFYEYMIRENILCRYAEIEGIEQVLRGITYRIKNRMQLNESIALFQESEKILGENFNRFFIELENFCSDYKMKLNII